MVSDCVVLSPIAPRFLATGEDEAAWTRLWRAEQIGRPLARTREGRPPARTEAC